MKRAGLGLALAAAAASMIACRGAPRNQPGAVADRFVEDYFVRIDQKEALPLTVAAAHEKLLDEIRDVEKVRDGASEAPDDAKQNVLYKRTYFDVSGDDARATYQITIEPRERSAAAADMVRYTYITLHRVNGQWRVADYTFGDSPLRR